MECNTLRYQIIVFECSAHSPVLENYHILFSDKRQFFVCLIWLTRSTFLSAIATCRDKTRLPEVKLLNCYQIKIDLNFPGQSMVPPQWNLIKNYVKRRRNGQSIWAQSPPFSTAATKMVVKLWEKTLRLSGDRRELITPVSDKTDGWEASCSSRCPNGFA